MDKSPEVDFQALGIGWGRGWGPLELHAPEFCNGLMENPRPGSSQRRTVGTVAWGVYLSPVHIGCHSFHRHRAPG